MIVFPPLNYADKPVHEKSKRVVILFKIEFQDELIKSDTRVLKRF